MNNTQLKLQPSYKKPEPRLVSDEYTDKDSDAFGLDTGPDTPTTQAEKDSCDINKIMERYRATGLLPDLIQREPIYGDFSDASTFHEAMEIVAVANTQFNALPAKVRERFANDPAKFLEFVESAESSTEAADELVRLGLADIRVAPPETEADILRSIRDNTKPQPDSTVSSKKGDPK